MVLKRSIIRLMMVIWAVATFLISLKVFTSNRLDDNHLKDGHLSTRPFHAVERQPIVKDDIRHSTAIGLNATPMLQRKKIDSKKDDAVFEREKQIDDFKTLVHTDHIHIDENQTTGWDLYLKFKNTGKRVWPENGEKDDRILNQIHLVHSDTAGKKLKKILLNAGLVNGMQPGQSRFIEHKCPVNQCSLTDRPEEAATADAILFKDHIKRPIVPRPPHQIWILFMLESPFYTQQFKHMEGQINWTATYRTDSTMVTPYERFAFFANYTGLPERPLKNYANGKTKKVAWFVSNCGATNGRMDYTKELLKYIEVDIYGSCGTLVCQRWTDTCNKKLEKEYKFYLAFENSNCKDYITEKLYVNALRNDVLPIVMGAMPEDYVRLAPPKSYIHVDDFDSPRALAEYLHKLDNDDELYNSYFRWKDTGRFIDTKFWCRLCSMVHETRRSKHHMVFDKLNEWWRGPNVCVNPQRPKKWASWRNVSKASSSDDLFTSWTE